MICTFHSLEARSIRRNQQSDSLTINGEVTISTWIYRNDDGSDWRNIYTIPDAHLLELDPSGAIRFRAENNDMNFEAWGESIPKETWTQITASMRKDSTGEFVAEVYINGQLSDLQASWHPHGFNAPRNKTGVRSADKDLFIGVLQNQAPWNGDPFIGGIDEFQIWNRALRQIKLKLAHENTEYVANDFEGEKTEYTTLKNESLVGRYYQ